MQQPRSPRVEELQNYPPRSISQRKRHKVQQACGNCRDRKTRCDGAKPICAACRRRDIEESCAYDQASNISRQYVAELENRIHILESERRSEPSNTGFIQPHRYDASESSRSTQAPFSSDYEGLGRSAASKSYFNEQVTQAHSDDIVDALATVASEDRDVHLYGDSSTIAFVRQVASDNRASVAGQETDPVQQTESDRRTTAAHSTSPLIPSALDLAEINAMAVLPLRRTADDFLHCFWEFIHPLFPVLHRTTFCAQYERLWRSSEANSASDEEDPVFMCQLNLLFAIGCQFSQCVTPGQKVAAAGQFYKRSQSVMLFDILGPVSISIVQTLLLTGIYLQSTSHASHCWNTVGLAIRLAQGRGLHIESIKLSANDQLAREMRRRIWHTCVVLDRLLSMTFGRPCMIDTSFSVPIPSMIDDDFLQCDGEGLQPAGQPSRLGLFVYSCRLFEILKDILSTFYLGSLENGDTPDFKLPPMIEHVLSFNRRLDTFGQSVPHYLSVERPRELIVSEKDHFVNLQQRVLYCRFLYVRLLSLRPLLLIAAKRPSKEFPILPEVEDSSSLDNDVIGRCCTLCVTTAHHLIETIHQHLETTYKSSGWHTVYFTFASATILVASLRLRNSVSCGQTGFELSWERCLLILGHYQAQVPTAERAIHVLKTLRHGMEDFIANNVRRLPQSDCPAQADHDGIEQSHRSGGQDDMPTTGFLDFSQFNVQGTGNLSDAWYNQQVINLDFMSLGEAFPSTYSM